VSVAPWEADHDLTPQAAAERIARAFPVLAGLPLVPLPEGWDFRTYAVGDRWVVRIAKRRTESQRLEREWSVLDRIADDLPVAVPRYALRQAATEQDPWALGGYERLPGTPLDAVVLEPELIARVAVRWGEAVGRLHAVSQERIRDLGLA
jgi:aminoglycoside phosphotransferase (APT) family kinase protein